MIIEADIAPVKKRIASKTLLILFIILLVYFQVFLSRVTDLPFRLLFDVLVLVLAASVTASTIINFRIKISHLSFLLSVMLFTIISSLGALDPSLSKSVVSSIIFSKFILIFFLARYVTMSDLEPAIKVFAFIHVVGCLSSLLFPSFFQGLLPSTTYELDVSRLMGFSLNANRAAAASSVLLLYFVFL